MHAMIGFRNPGKTINSFVDNGKRFMAYELVKRLKDSKGDILLQQLQAERNSTEISEGKLHKVFETSFDWKECRTDKFILQKLNYIHANPCKSGLVDNAEGYEHSPARFYITGEHGVYKVMSYSELQDGDLTVGP